MLIGVNSEQKKVGSHCKWTYASYEIQLIV